MTPDLIGSFLHANQSEMTGRDPVWHESDAVVVHGHLSRVEVRYAVDGDGGSPGVAKGIAKGFCNDRGYVSNDAGTRGAALVELHLHCDLVVRDLLGSLLDRFDEARLSFFSEIGHGCANFLHETSNGVAQELEVVGENRLARVLKDCQVDGQTKGCERGADLIVKLASQPGSLLVDRTSGDILKQLDIREGQSDRSQRLLRPHQVRRWSAVGRLRP